MKAKTFLALAGHAVAALEIAATAAETAAAWFAINQTANCLLRELNAITMDETLIVQIRMESEKTGLAVREISRCSCEHFEGLGGFKAMEDGR